MSVAWNHKERVQKFQAAEAARLALEKQEQQKRDNLAKSMKDFEALALSLKNDCARLSDLPRGPERDQVKREELIPLYMKSVDQYLESESEHENPILVRVMIWAFDVGNIDLAMKLAAVAIEQGQPMPQNFKSNVRTFVADSVLEWVAKQQIDGGAIDPYFSDMFNQVLDWSIHDQIKAKFCKVEAKRIEEQEPEKALELYQKALAFDVNAGVKTAMKKLASRIEKAKAEAAEAEKAKTDKDKDKK